MLIQTLEAFPEIQITLVRVQALQARHQVHHEAIVQAQQLQHAGAIVLDQISM